MSNLARFAYDDGSIQWSESDLQMAVASLLRQLGITFAADMNAGRRSARRGARLKHEGMAAGEPDLRLYMPGGQVIFIEMKTMRGKLSKVQRERHDRLRQLGFEVHVCQEPTPAAAQDFVLGLLNLAKKSKTV